ncbi:MAG TPA: hypothetical protein VF605_14945 [Allosphingosinicella sp.]
MRHRHQGQARPAERPLEPSRGGWALFGRLLIWSTRNSRRED